MTLTVDVRELATGEAPADTLAGRARLVARPAPRSAPPRQAHRSPVPLPITSFVGRVAELGVVRQLLANARLVTLTGPGGCGKTRLALEAVARSGDSSAVFVSLAPLDDPGLIAPTVARSLAIREGVGRPAWEAVAAALEDRRLLLVLDNFEHLLDGAAVVSRWLAACSGLTVLATSRERLRLQGEHVYAVPPLGLTDAEHPDPRDSEAVRLFLERARTIEPLFAPTDRTASAIAALCRRLDGLPLAIELAAARCQMLSPEAMLARLDRTPSTSSLELLGGGARDLPPRQQTLRRTIAWSYELLDEPERQLFRRLAVFVGGFTLGAVEAVARDEGRGAREADADSQLTTRYSPLDGVGALLERSLLRRVDGSAEDPRFEMLVMLREYAAEQLVLSGEDDAFRARHARYFHDLAEEIAPRLHGPEQARWLDALEADHGNLRAAMAWSAEHDLDLALGLGGALWRFWQVRGRVAEARAWLEGVVAADAARPATVPTPSRARALNAVAFLAFMAGDYARAIGRYREALAIRRMLGDREGVAESLNNLGLTLRSIGDHAGAAELFEEALTLSRALGNRAREANVLNNLARSAYYRGEHAAARALHEQALTAGREAGDAWAVAICLGDLGDVHQAEDDGTAARRLYEESLEAWRALGDLRGVAQCLEGFAGLVLSAEPELAVRLFGAGAAVREAIGEPSSLVRRIQVEQTLAHLREAVGADRFAAAWSEGRALSADEAVMAALGQNASDTASAAEAPAASNADIGWGPLTRREIDVAQLVVEGRSNRQIAAALIVSERTVGTHLDHIFAKLGVSSRTAVVTYAFRRGLA